MNHEGENVMQVTGGEAGRLGLHPALTHQPAARVAATSCATDASLSQTERRRRNRRSVAGKITLQTLTLHNPFRDMRATSSSLITCLLPLFSLTRLLTSSASPAKPCIPCADHDETEWSINSCWNQGDSGFRESSVVRGRREGGEMEAQE